MSSRKLEVDHETKIRELLSRAGLLCPRTSTPSITSEIEEESAGDYAEENIEVHEEEMEKEETEEAIEVTEETAEIEAEIFPTPSLRRVIPEEQRRIEEMNRIRVLPFKFPAKFEAESIPIIAQTPPADVMDVLGSMTGCSSYKTNLAEYWFLDTLANLLRRAQEERMGGGSQAALMAWFCEWMKEMQHFDAADRQRMIRRFQSNITAAAKFIADHHHLPTPEEAGVTYEAYTKEAASREKEDSGTDSANKNNEETGKKNDIERKKDDRSQDTKHKNQVSKVDKKKEKKRKRKTIAKSGKDDTNSEKTNKNPVENYADDDDIDSRKGDEGYEKEEAGAEDENEASSQENFECAMVDLTHIAHYIYDLFSTDYQYDLVRSVITFSPEYTQVDGAYQMKVPKRLLPHKRPELEKTSTRTSLLTMKDQKQDDYTKLLELQKRDESALAEQELRDKTGWLRQSHILPLSAAREDAYRYAAQSDSCGTRDGH